MRDETSIVIGIQARSTSQRFPGKVFEKIGGRPLLSHVISSCNSACDYINKNMGRFNIKCSVALVIPWGDAIKENDYFKHITKTYEGDEFDVLSRYVTLKNLESADYIVRVTGDCPLIPPYLISKSIKIALKNRYDYLSNVDPEEVRLSPDGWDCEVMSAKLIDWLDDKAKDKASREHVTIHARRNWPIGYKRGVIIPFADMSDLKISVDNQEDLARVRKTWEKIQSVKDLTEATFGKSHAHRV